MENKKEKHDATQDARKVQHAGTELQQRDLTHKGPTYASSPRSILRFTHALPHYISFCCKKKQLQMLCYGVTLHLHLIILAGTFLFMLRLIKYV